jgi:hypothetical protein
MVNLKNLAPFLSGGPLKCKRMGRGGGGGVVGATFFGKNVPKIIFAIMGGSKYFSDLFRPQFSEHVAQFQHSGPPSWKIGPPLA